jgi:uncharacterized protein (TIGR03000 family)
MYGVVAMAALLAGGEAPEFGGRSSYGGCYGCYGYGCYGSGYGSGYGGGGWCSGCYGSWSYGGWCSGCYGSWSYGCCGCSGYSGYSGYSSCGGCYGCTGCYGTWSSSPYFPMYQQGPVMPPADPGSGSTQPEKKTSSASPDRARLVIELPADAKLSIDDQPMRATSSVRTFQTPVLDKSATYYYILKVEVVRDKETLTESRRLIIKAGDDLKASFTEAGIKAASRGAGAESTASR